MTYKHIELIAVAGVEIEYRLGRPLTCEEIWHVARLLAAGYRAIVRDGKVMFSGPYVRGTPEYKPGMDSGFD